MMAKSFSVTFKQNDGESAIKATVYADNDEGAVEEMIKMFPGMAENVSNTEDYTLIVEGSVINV